jgi:hypothetical protein
MSRDGLHKKGSLKEEGLTLALVRDLLEAEVGEGREVIEEGAREVKACV